MSIRLPLPPPRWRWLVVLAAVACAGCSGGGESLNPVQGKILYKGQPLAGAVLTFHPKGGGKDITKTLPTGLSGEDGVFKVMTGKKEGAPAGEYAVTVICSEEVNPQAKGKISTAPPETKDRFGLAFANRDNTSLRATIKAGPNQLEPFQLK
jgi:hypothetical protein